jgi:hypothetical protein
MAGLRRRFVAPCLLLIVLCGSGCIRFSFEIRRARRRGDCQCGEVAHRIKV